MQKDKNYLPHLTWPEVKEYLNQSDVAIMPIGSIEQHGPALPLGTDSLLAYNVAREAARWANVICVPSTWVGLSAHHMMFAGSLTLSQDTFIKVIVEVASGLAQHGFRKIVLYNGHGGNEVAMSYAADLITNNTPAQALLFGIAELRKIYLKDNAHLLDIHAGIGETSGMLAAYPELVEMERLEKPTMTLEPFRQKLLEQVRQDSSLLRYVTLGLPAVHEISSNGCITIGDPHEASVERGKSNFEEYVKTLVGFIQVWETAASDQP
jgi:creatinine amidohydrolase